VTAHVFHEIYQLDRNKLIIGYKFHCVIFFSAVFKFNAE